MTEKKEKYPSTFTIENFSSTATLANNDQIKIPIGSSDKLGEKEYNPYEHRVIEHPNTFFGAVVHLLKSSLGTGILAIPRAFKSAGLIVGLFGTIFIGVMCTHTIHILVKASQKVCTRAKLPSLGFAETAEEVCRQGPAPLRGWATFAKNFVEIALVLTYYCGNAVYVVFITESLTKLFAPYFPETASWDQYFKLMILVPLILCCQVRELKHLVPFSFIANTSMIIAFSITLYYTFAQLAEVKVSDRNLVTTPAGIPSFFSTVIFAMEGIGTIMPVENSMEKPQFIGCPGVLNSAMTAVVLLFSAIGFFGYLSFGEETQATITTNLPSEEIPAQVVQASISLAVFFTFMLQFYVPLDITWRRIKDKIPQNRHNISQILLRTGIVIFITGIAAAAGHHLDALIDLVGAVFFSTLGLLVPAVIEIIVDWDGDWGVLYWRLIKDLAIICLAIFGLISGSYSAIQSVL
ncbi:proton-coupled amino acid transporter-like protein pathetic isoform X2 [Cylas formicarius]|uniref:proton-coupled amino acid transporter-like protein pathetic isoform X2 n=1 Tax=Cylas formicarius TaxID=197179 RepID=UPI002958A3FF|nr:proton-coupled amino acid transporter-like protein pathetic isoform X2 [Cylas formicarius]XP_060530581.1 proton-coupled amino acid transporter-like protein pathetic isoform X2 [Cylas formicarius]